MKNLSGCIILTVLVFICMEPAQVEAQVEPPYPPDHEDWYSVNINCAGGATAINGIDYEADEDLGGPAKYFPLRETWETSSTGLFWDTAVTSRDFIAQNVSILRRNNSELYTRARLSPLSLTYYFRCLANGSYTVTLHFAEIVIRDNRSYQSLGRRIFDVYVQALVLQQKGNLMELVDPRLGTEFNKEEAIRMTRVALLCTNSSPALRPTMSEVVNMLEGRTLVPELIMDPTIFADESRFGALKDQLNQMRSRKDSEPTIVTGSSDSSTAWLGSSSNINHIQSKLD
ncbi:hypothetical protein V6N13_011392 [Hibiscus sabdariffa]